VYIIDCKNETIFNLIIIIISALIAIAFYTLTERKFIGDMQFRKGTNKPLYYSHKDFNSRCGKNFWTTKINPV